MNWAEVIIEGLPPLRGDEPRSLRGDIADELADHLACALKRELRRTDDEAAAERNVLERFGNPTAIARRLWWDAMKESIMKERITIGIMAGFLLLAAVAAVFTWQALREGRQVNTAILAKLEQLAKPSEPAKPGVSENWTKVVVRATVEGSGAPKSGLTMQLAGAAFSEKSETLFASTDAEGSASFGPIRPGRYMLYVNDDEPEHPAAITGSGLWMRWQLTLYPGQSREIALTYPAAPYADVSLRRVGELPKPEDVLACSFEPHGYIKAGKDDWSTSSFHVCVKRDGEVLLRGNVQSESRTSEGLVKECTGPFKTAPTLRIPATKYILRRLELARPVPGRGTSELCWAKCGWLNMDRPGGEATPRPPGPMGEEAFSPSSLLAPEFNATAGKNEWPIQVPTELLTEYQKTMERAAEAKKHAVPPPGGPMGGGMTGGAMPPPGGPMGGGMMGGAMPPPLPGQPARPVMSGSRPAAASRPSR